MSNLGQVNSNSINLKELQEIKPATSIDSKAENHSAKGEVGDEHAVNSTPNDSTSVAKKGTATESIDIFGDPFHKPILCTTPPTTKLDPGIAISIKELMKNPDPKAIVDTIRNAKGDDRDNALVSFQGKIDNLSKGDLKAMRDYLVQEMASPTNKDDKLLGTLLKTVNKELDSRSNSLGDLTPINRPFPIDKDPFKPEPIICPPINKRDPFKELEPIFPKGHDIDPGFSVEPKKGFHDIDPGFSVEPKKGFKNIDPGIMLEPKKGFKNIDPGIMPKPSLDGKDFDMNLKVDPFSREMYKGVTMTEPKKGFKGVDPGTTLETPKNIDDVKIGKYIDFDKQKY